MDILHNHINPSPLSKAVDSFFKKRQLHMRMESLPLQMVCKAYFNNDQTQTCYSAEWFIILNDKVCVFRTSTIFTVKWLHSSKNCCQHKYMAHDRFHEAGRIFGTNLLR